MSDIFLSSGKYAGLLIAVVLFSATAAAAGPPEDINPETPGEKTPKQLSGNLSNKTSGNPLSMVPGLENRTMPSMPELPAQASDVAKTVTSTIGGVFDSAADMSGGIGSFLSDALSFLDGSEQVQQPEHPVNGTNSTQRG